MRASTTKNGLTVRVIAGTKSAILAFDLQENKRDGCLGFSIQRTNLGTAAKPIPANQQTVWLPNMIRFPNVPLPAGKTFSTTEDAPLQKFRWGDYTLDPATTYRFKVIPRYGTPNALETRPDLADGVEVEITTEDPNSDETAVFFNRAAAASAAFNEKFADVKDISDTSSPDAAEARKWLSNGLEEAILAFLNKAQKGDALHAAVYEFQKPELLKGIKDAALRGVDVKVAYHHRNAGAKDKTYAKNDAAVKAAGIDVDSATAANLKLVVKPRKSNPQNAIMHNKFVVLLKNDGTKPVPTAVWTGSTNWTDGGVYGQLNVGHAVYEANVAALYENYFQLLFADSDAATMKHVLSGLTPVSVLLSGEHKVTPIFSPQSADTMLHLYASLCDGAKMLLVSAPFALSPFILTSLSKKNDDILRFLLLDKAGSLGKGEMVNVIEGDPNDSIAVATTISEPLTDYQGKLLEGKESFRHAGIHIHSKIIMVDPFGSDPIIVTGSANFSNNSTEVNDSNSMIIRGYTAIADIYATDFMRMFEHYHFRAKEAAAKDKSKTLALAADDSWSNKYYVSGSSEEKDRRMFAGTF
jgi:phosphatidylserine/phosphatidylglycerophosphate/cardiolipin synthase-like enzyme